MYKGEIDNVIGKRTSKADYLTAIALLKNQYGVTLPEGADREITIQITGELLNLEIHPDGVSLAEIAQIIGKYIPALNSGPVKPEQQNT